MQRAPDDDIIIIAPGLTLIGTSGVDSLVGGIGNDYLEGMAGADILNGMGGSDTASYASSNVAVTVNLQTNVNTGGHAQGDILLNIENLQGSSFSDTLTGNSGNNTFTGGSGSDQLNGGLGIDTASYTASAAAINVNMTTFFFTGGDAQGDSYNSIENVTGSAYNDSITGDANVNVLNGMSGNDTLAGMDGGDTLYGGVGTDLATYTQSTAGVTVNLTTNVNTGGHAQGDILSSIENVFGSNYADNLTGNSVANALSGSGGNDTLEGRGGADVLDGGSGTDTASYANSTAAVTINLTTAVHSGGDAAGDVLTAIENITGSGYNDFITGSSTVNVLTGGNGDDVLEGKGGADTIDGGGGFDIATYATSTSGVTINLATGINSGSDAAGDILIGIEKIIGSNNNDVLTGNAAANNFMGGGGADLLSGGAGADILDGGGDIDTVTYATSTAGVVVNLTTGVHSGGDAAGDVLSNIENITGSTLNDQLTGNAVANTLLGGDGNDMLNGMDGADVLNGGNGLDTATYINSTVAVNVNLQTNTATGGHAQGDTFLNIENLSGSNYNDVLTGNASANVLTGGLGNDILEGRGGADNIDGGLGIDTVSYANSSSGVTVSKYITTAQTSGGDANGDVILNIEDIIGSNSADILTGFTNMSGGNGNDTFYFHQSASSTMAGGAGADKFVFDSGVHTGTSNGVVTDFVQGQDDVQLQNGLTYTQLLNAGAITYTGAGTQIDYGNDHLLVQNVNLIASDFI